MSKRVPHRAIASPCEPAKYADHDTLGQKLANDPASRGPDGQPNSDFSLARCGASSHQARHIGACNQQNQTHGAHQHVERFGQHIPNARQCLVSGATSTDASLSGFRTL